MQIIETMSLEQVEALLTSTGVEFTTFPAPSDRPTTVEFTLSRTEFAQQKDALGALGITCSAWGGCIAIPPQVEGPSLLESYEAMTADEKAAADAAFERVATS